MVRQIRRRLQETRDLSLVELLLLPLAVFLEPLLPRHPREEFSVPLRPLHHLPPQLLVALAVVCLELLLRRLPLVLEALVLLLRPLASVLLLLPLVLLLRQLVAVYLALLRLLQPLVGLVEHPLLQLPLGHLQQLPWVRQHQVVASLELQLLLDLADLGRHPRMLRRPCLGRILRQLPLVLLLHRLICLASLPLSRLGLHSSHLAHCIQASNRLRRNRLLQDPFSLPILKLFRRPCKRKLRPLRLM